MNNLFKYFVFETSYSFSHGRLVEKGRKPNCDGSSMF